VHKENSKKKVFSEYILKNSQKRCEPALPLEETTENTKENDNQLTKSDFSPLKSFVDPILGSSSRRMADASTHIAKSSGSMTDEEIKRSLEEDLLGLVGRMKGYARNYKEQLTRDKHVRLASL
jgi:hypothetical protein